MGYETTLLIGKSTSLIMDEYAEGELIISDGEAYRPYLKDDDGEPIKTGRRETFFMIMATIDMCKCGYDSNISKIDHTNKDKNHFWYWYIGEEKQSEDKYGEMLKPIPIRDALDALEKDSAADDYRRFKWAIGLLRAMVDDSEGLSVLLYGH